MAAFWLGFVLLPEDAGQQLLAAVPFQCFAQLDYLFRIHLVQKSQIQAEAGHEARSAFDVAALQIVF
jgi:hypothetical protein